MDASQIYNVIVIAIIVVLFIVFFLTNRKAKNKKLTPLAAIAFAFVIAGIVFGENRPVGYSLLFVGVALAMADIVLRMKKSNRG
ncbi:hypothetical protein [Anaerobium acetethylicum]|uniref:Uncharacterized protein n=1 Tax=Anaerobium acetethylicum TaxID=1619234 RepID=A0A1D3TN76_9FIRM|nr:hypothetical protein [Anaerobium acetethylicum]SCP94757.1 hypothetical protein SAMN05421730_100128 [Anaerobium acetethylicum]